MMTRSLGRSGLQVSTVGLGCNNFSGRLDFEGSRAVVHKALDLGITLFDTADMYGINGGSEEYLGKLLGSRRKDVVVATKFGFISHDPPVARASRGYIMEAVEGSLKRLNTDWIDLYQVHRYDDTTPIEETLRALDDLVRQGKVRYIGCSNFAPWKVVDAQWTAKSLGLERMISCQDEYSLLARGAEDQLLPAMASMGLGLLPFFPLANGMLAGNYQRGAPLPAGRRLSKRPEMVARVFTDANWDKVERLQAYAQAHGHTLLELSIAWLASHPLVASVIAGASKPEQVEQNVLAAQWTLTPQQRAEVDQLT